MHAVHDRVLIGIPAYDEEQTIGAVLTGVRRVLPEADIAVVDDGSTDRTSAVVETGPAGVTLIRLPCNLGYSNAIETLLRYAVSRDYDTLITLDADGQHDPALLPPFIDAYRQCDCDLLIGSRFLADGVYRDQPLGRRIGMWLFSVLTRLLGGTRIYDTTSGMKVISREVMTALLTWQFHEFHAEMILFMLWSNYRIGEHRIEVRAREYGTSMHARLSSLWYPLKVLLLIALTWYQYVIVERRAQTQ